MQLPSVKKLHGIVSRTRRCNLWRLQAQHVSSSLDTILVNFGPCRHNIGSSYDFDFASYLRESLEDDYSSLVGLSTPVWLIIVGSLLLSWVLGELMRLQRRALPARLPCASCKGI